MEKIHFESSWYNKTMNPPKVKRLLESIVADCRNPKRRYEHLEFLLRSIPGNVGINIRYNVLSKFYGACGSNVIIWPDTKIKHADKLYVGNNVQIGHNNHYQASGGIIIGNNTLIGPGVKLWTINHVFVDTERDIRDQGYLGKGIEIGEDCWLWANVFVKAGASIPQGSVVTANSVVGAGSFPPYHVLDGRPAKPIASRSRMGNIQRVSKKCGGQDY